jgi:hypothetical protein
LTRVRADLYESSASMRAVPLLVLLAASLSGVALAQDAPREVTVHVVSGMDERLTERVIEALTSQLSDVHARVRVDPRSDVGDGLGYVDASEDAVWVDAKTRGALVVARSNPAGRQAIVRRLRLSRTNDDAVLEEAAIIARSTVLALSAPAVRALPVAAPPPPVDPPAVVVAEPPRPKEPLVASSGPPALVAPKEGTPPPARTGAPIGWVGASYVGTQFSSPGGWESGLGLFARYLTRARAYGTLGYDVLPTEHVTVSAVGLDLARHPASVGLGYEVPGGRPWHVEGEISLVVDAVTRTTTGGGAAFQPSPATTRVFVAVAPRVRAAWNPVRILSLFGGGGVDVVTNDFSYVAAPNAPVLRPFPVRPRIEVGVAVGFP